MRAPVKGMSEAGRQREARALVTRDRVVESARRLFESHGYAATTVAAIADEAGVAAATVYQAFGTKYAILARALDTAITDDDVPMGLLDRPWVQQVRQSEDPYQRLAMIVEHTSTIAARTATLKQAMRDAAAADPQVRDLMREDHRRRLQTQTALVEIVLRDVPRHPGVDPDEAVATYFGLVNSDSYLLMAHTLGWDLERWQRWLIRVLAAQLL